ncbi:MAG: hypothetical protein NTW97_05180 [Candidatus Krumholzibacteria bacterium]|nr:hypothetical protein [Candidatus Krumholzibacteria bacterium]
MTKKSKVYVIDPADATESSTQKVPVGKRGIERTEYSPDSEGPQDSRQRGPRPRGSQPRERRANDRVDEKGSPLLAFLAYLAGPYAILATHRGRESRFWVALAILSFTGAAVLFARANKILAAPHGAGIGFVLWLSVACLAIGLAFATWARGVFLLGRHKGWLLRRLPTWLRHPGAAGVLGLVIPGFGLFIAQHPRRAACALFAACATVVSALVLRQAPDLWRLSRAGILVEHGDILERIFLVMGAVGTLGALAWIAQALDGARLAGIRAEGSPGPHSETSSGRHGDWFTVALVLAIAAVPIAFKPSQVAETLDRFAISLSEDGLRIIPLAAVDAATRLDPSRPEYAVRAIELNEALGQLTKALAIRRDLAERWKPYERMLRREAAIEESPVFGTEEP